MEKDAAEKMRCFSAKSAWGFIWALSFKWKSRFLQFLSAELTENKIKSMPEILAPRSFKWCIVCSFFMLSCWEDAFQANHPFFHTKIKTFISQQRSSAGMFGSWFYDVLGLPQPLIPITQNRYVDSALWDLDQLLKYKILFVSRDSFRFIFNLIRWAQNAFNT